MAISFFATEVSDLCLGKPPLRSLPTTATVADAVIALKRSGDIYVSVWSCESVADICDETSCVGKICMVDVIVHLCKEENPLDALQSNILDVVPKDVKVLIKHLEPNSSLLEAIDCIIDGAQNLVIPIYTNPRRKQLTNPSVFNQQFCWLTQEDVVRFLLNFIGIFSPIPTFTIEALDLIQKSTLPVNYHDPAITTLPLISSSLLDQTSIAVVDKDNRLIGEISPLNLACCDLTVAAAIATLSAGDLMAYIDCSGPSDDLVSLVKMRLHERNLTAMLDLMDDYYIHNPLSSSSSCSSDEEFGSVKSG